VLLLQPESPIGVSFQMSFGAVIALIAVAWGAQLGQLLRRGSTARKALGYCAGVAVNECGNPPVIHSGPLPGR